jgi:hypothetical protein
MVKTKVTILQTYVTVADILLMHFRFLLLKTFELFGFPVFLLWVYMMKVIPETIVLTKSYSYVFITSCLDGMDNDTIWQYHIDISWTTERGKIDITNTHTWPHSYQVSYMHVEKRGGVKLVVWA